MLRTIPNAIKKRPLIPVAIICLTFVCLFVAIKVSTDAREAANRTSCRSHLKIVGLATQNALKKDGRLLAATTGDPPISWRVTMLPYLDLKEMHARYQSHMPWDSSENARLAEISLPIYQCPSYKEKAVSGRRGDGSARYLSQYAMMTGADTAGRGVAPEDITDGVSHTVIIGEACDLNITWSEPRDVPTETQTPGVNLTPPKVGWLSSRHPLGSHALFADGHVSLISKEIDAKRLRALVTINEGENVDGY